MFFNRKPIGNTLCAFSFNAEGLSFVMVEKNGKEKPRILHWETVSCPQNDYLVVLRGLSKQFKLSKRRCAFTLHADDYRLLHVDAPPVPEDEMVAAIKWDVQDIIDLPVEETTFDIFPTPEDSGQSKSVNVVAARRAPLVEKIELLKKAKINLTIVDIEELALLNLVSAVSGDVKGVVGILLHDSYGVINFCKNGELYFTRRLELGFNNLDQTHDTLESLALEIQRSIDYFDRHFSTTSMSSVALMPSFEAATVVSQFLNNNLSLPCVVSDLHEGLEWIVGSITPITDDLILTLGAALRSEKVVA